MVQCITDQSQSHGGASETFLIDEKRLEVLYAGCSVRLTKKQLDILKELVSDPGRVFSRQELLKRVWGDTIFVDGRTIDAHIVKLRQKIKRLGKRLPTIETVWGLGYRLVKRSRIFSGWDSVRSFLSSLIFSIPVVSRACGKLFVQHSLMMHSYKMQSELFRFGDWPHE